MADVELPDPEEMEEQSKSRFTKGVALVVAVYAVALAVTALGGSNAGKDMMMAKQEAANRWSYYQAKVVREHLYLLQAHEIELRLDEQAGALSPSLKTKTEKLLSDCREKAKTYSQEKEEIKTEAENFEKECKENMEKDPYFDYAEVLLQIAIVMASVSMLANSRPIFAFSLLVAAVGVFLTVDGFLMFYPFL